MFFTHLLHSPPVAKSVCQCQSKGKVALEIGIIKIPAQKGAKTAGKYKTIDPLAEHFSHTCYIYVLYYLRSIKYLVTFPYNYSDQQ